MREGMRFASLRGEARRWIEDELFDEVENRKSEEHNDDVWTAEHDGWAPIEPRKRYVRVADFVRAQRATRSGTVSSAQNASTRARAH